MGRLRSDIVLETKKNKSGRCWVDLIIFTIWAKELELYGALGGLNQKIMMLSYSMLLYNDLDN